MAAATTAAIISGAAALGAAGTSAAAQSSMNKKTREFNKEEAEKQRLWAERMYNESNAWNYEMWQKEMEYNTPANQVQRLRDAGLNPMYYGLDGNSTNGGPDAAQPLGYDRAQASDQPNPISAGIDSAVKVAQVSNIQADTAKKNNENLTETQRREKMLAEIDEVKQNVKLKLAQEGLTNAERQKLEKDIEWLDRLNEATIAEKESSAKLSNAQKKRIEELLEGEKIIQSKTIEDFDHKWQKINAEIAKIAGENKLLAKDLENYALNHANNGFMGTGLSLQNLIRGGSEVGKTINEHPKTKEGKSILAEDNR